MKSDKPKRFSSTVLGMFILLSAFTALNFASMNVLADEFWNNGHTVSGTEWYENCVITMEDGNLTIPNGTSLIFGNAVTFEIICGYSGQYGINIEDTGTFIINSTNSDTTITYGSSPGIYTYPFLNSGTIDFL